MGQPAHGGLLDGWLEDVIATPGLTSLQDPAEARRVLLDDAAGYRDRRQATLDALALRMAEQAAATGQRVELEPMTAVERKIVHEPVS